MRSVDVTVTVANWNRADLLEKCLQSVLATQPTIRYEIIVVDNASGDDSVAMVRRRFPEVRLLVNAANVGFGRAQNQAMGIASGRYLLVLNNDAEVRPDTLPRLVRFMDDHPRAGICGCPSYEAKSSSEPMSGAWPLSASVWRGTLLWNVWLVGRPPLGWDTVPIFKPAVRLLTGGRPVEREGEVSWVTGALLMLRREMVVATGGFDEDFVFLFEDVDLCRRSWQAGWPVLFTTATSYVHIGGASSRLRSDIETLRGKSGVTYFRKHHGRVAAAAFRLQHTVLREWLLPLRYRLGALIRSLPRVRSATSDCARAAEKKCGVDGIQTPEGAR